MGQRWPRLALCHPRSGQHRDQCPAGARCVGRHRRAPRTRPARCNGLPLGKGILVQFSSGKASSTTTPGRTFLSLTLPWRHRRKPDRNFQLQQKSSSCLPGLPSANICRWERREERDFAGSKGMGEAARRPLVRSKLKCCPGEGAERVPEPTAPFGACRRSQCCCPLHPWEKGGVGTAHPRGSLHVLGSCCPEKRGKGAPAPAAYLAWGPVGWLVCSRFSFSICSSPGLSEVWL